MDQHAIPRGERARVRRDAEPFSQPASAPAFVDHRPGAVSLRKLSDAMHDSPRMAAQRALVETMHDSPRVAAQRRLGDGMSARTVQQAQPIQRTISFEYDEGGNEYDVNRNLTVSEVVAELVRNFRFDDDYELRDILFDFDEQNAIFSDFPELVKVLEERLGGGELSREQLNAIIDNPEAGEAKRIEAEGALKDLDEQSVARIKTMAVEGNFAGVLEAAARLVGITDIPVRPTTDYASVIPENVEIPRGTPHGVTVPKESGPVVYIHEDWITRWAEEGAIGNLLSTIIHETTHAKQYLANQPAADRGDAKEFEAYAEEITTAYTTARQFETSLLPDAHHIQTAYDKAKEHYDNLNPEEKIRYARKMEEIETIMPRLIRHLEQTDVESGRTAGRIRRIEDLIKLALQAETSGKVSELQIEAKRILQTLPAQEQRRLGEPLEKVDARYRQLWRSFK